MNRVTFAVLSWILASSLLAQTPDAASHEPVDDSAATSGSFSLFSTANLTENTENLVKASASLERFGDSLERVSVALVDGLARMSSGFDPLGYQGAFRTIGQQTELIQQQQAQIYELQQREIERLKKENKQLQRRVAELQKQDRSTKRKPGRKRGN